MYSSIVSEKIKAVSEKHGLAIVMPFSQAERHQNLQWVAVVKIEIIGLGFFGGQGSGENAEEARIDAINRALAKASLEVEY